MGYMWVDTSTSVGAGGTVYPYFPPQTPPGSGFNSFTDTSGEVWVSRNGSAWKRARDGLHCRVYRNAAFTTQTSLVAFQFDTVVSDPYAMYNVNGNFTAPVAGIYQFHAVISWGGNTGAVGMALDGFGWSPNQGAPVVQDLFGQWRASLVEVVSLGATGTTRVDFACQSGGVAGAPGQQTCYATMDYLGTG